MSKAVDAINGTVDSFVEVVEHTAASLAIPVADGVVSWLAAENMVRTLGFSWPVSLMTGIALEGCGIVTSRAALAVRHFNQTRPESEPAALEWMAWAMLGVQFVVGAVLVTVNTVATSSMLFGLLTLATLSAVGTLAHMLENDVKAREKSPSAQTPAAPVAREDAPDLADVAQEMAQAVIIEQPSSTRERVVRYMATHPGTRQQDVADELGISRQTVSKYAGSNGNGRH